MSEIAAKMRKAQLKNDLLFGWVNIMSQSKMPAELKLMAEAMEEVAAVLRIFAAELPSAMQIKSEQPPESDREVVVKKGSTIVQLLSDILKNANKVDLKHFLISQCELDNKGAEAWMFDARAAVKNGPSDSPDLSNQLTDLANQLIGGILSARDEAIRAFLNMQCGFTSDEVESWLMEARSHIQGEANENS